MAKKRKQKVAPPAQAEPGGGLGGLAAALRASGLAPVAPPEAPSPPPTAAPKAPPKAPETAPTAPRPPATPGAKTGEFKGKVVVRREKKGRGGKTATVIQGASIVAADRAALAKRLRKALGCGAREEGETVVVQGDQREPAKAWLEKQGAVVVIGN